jgi:hypothetical protein
MGRHLSQQFVEGAFTNAGEITTKEDLTGPDRFLNGRLSMNQRGHLTSQGFVRRTRSRVGDQILLQSYDLISR